MHIFSEVFFPFSVIEKNTVKKNIIIITPHLSHCLFYDLLCSKELSGRKAVMFWWVTDAFTRFHYLIPAISLINSLIISGQSSHESKDNAHAIPSDKPLSCNDFLHSSFKYAFTDSLASLISAKTSKVFPSIYISSIYIMSVKSWLCLRSLPSSLPKLYLSVN